MLEIRRQLFHLFFGIAMLIIGLVFGKAGLIALLGGLLIIGLILIQFAMAERRHPLLTLFLEKLDRPEDLPGRGALTYVAGLLLAVCFADSLSFTLAIIAILAFGDSFSTLVGISGMHKLPFSGRKTLEGFGAFVIAATVGASLFIQPESALVYSFVLGIVELVDLKVDDNLSIPAVALLLRAVF
ncbi:MAG: hypothetical protein V1811_02670 [Candidatus Micrarchaeota archaeon]